MGSHITPEELARIEAFGRNPSYLRRLEQPLPEEATAGEESVDGAAADDRHGVIPRRTDHT
jgi:hypothetical protein